MVVNQDAIMATDRQYVLSGELLAQLIGDAATLSRYLQEDFNEIASCRDHLRARLLAEDQIVTINPECEPLAQVCTVDGAHLPENDRATAYSASCSLRVGLAPGGYDHSSCLSILPHLPCHSTLSTGLMIMQEIMTTVDSIKRYPEAYCLIDGSRVSALRQVNQFYANLDQDLPYQLDHWRRLARLQPDREPGRTLNLFESRDWLSVFLSSDRIIGNAKLVTTISLVSRYMPEWVGRFDDKTFAALVLEPGEALRPVPLKAPKEPYHIHSSYPRRSEVDAIGDLLTSPNHPQQILHLYYRPCAAHGVYKIEMSSAFLDQPQRVSGLLAWWFREVAAPDIEEPYSVYIADRFASEAVSLAKEALKEISRRGQPNSPWTWFLTQPHRTN
jgi:hypothetical protein